MLKSFWFWFTLTFISIQFVPMDVPEKIENDPKEVLQLPKEVEEIFKRSCYVCHSNSMHYPWYDKIAPASWFAKEHVKNGRRAVNFSVWHSYDRTKQLKILEKLPKAITIRMPLPAYLWLHEEASLSSDDRKVLRKWAKSLKEKIK